ncbi:MAG: hypothetical protein KA383_02940 [Phycisphaerae bacterium]|nr:hypothetical protein [Phycisphaerae bacterium]
MRKLLALYGGLPREVKMLVAMAGLATPIGIIFFLQRYLFHGAPTWLIILGVAAFFGVIALISWVLSKLFGRASRRRARRMEAELAGAGAAGPVSMDLRAAIKSNNEKFFNAIKEMRRLGIRVYDLPWYVVIGDSGCGKTKLINEGGLTFSTGKPEGYQLGTLNYNWWFTEDAIFIDMAGRLCNPQEDADRREWEAFLKTIGTGRRGYPINGVLCCVSAEHLLQESPEQHEADANTLLERLRDLQAKLGVTFATYLVVTKCDKIVGFMQFFDRAERDITIKNQIFGWSRPGNFNELRDPELFTADFDGVYGRLNELRLRRLNDEVDEHELGLAYSFPEEFRQLKEPLQTYMRTLFPAIKNPRAVKNLICRGVYFTSATQQGGLILRHLTERLGADAAGQFPPLESLYPRPRPHFVKDLLFRKVFPEEGLVFRNEQEVVRNRKLARALTIGTAVLAVGLIALLVVGSIKFGRLIAEPRSNAQQSREFATRPVAETFTEVVKFGQYATGLRASIWPTVLSVGFGSERPANDLKHIQMRLFERGVLRRAMDKIDAALRSAPIVADETTEGGVPRPVFEASLREYVRWTGCAPLEQRSEAINQDSFQALSAPVAATPELAVLTSTEGRTLAGQFFSYTQARGGASNPARLMTQGGRDPSATIHAALVNLHNYLQAYATLNAANPDPVIGEWMRIRDCCEQIRAAYARLLAAADQPAETQEQLEVFRKDFNENYARLTQALADCNWRLKSGGTYLRIPLLRAAIRRQRQAWLDYQAELTKAYATCGVHSDASNDSVTQAVAALLAGNDQDMRGLQRVLWESVVAAGLADERPYAAEYFGDAFDKLVREVDETYGFIISVKRVDEKGAGDDLLTAAPELRDTIVPVLTQIHDQLASLDAATSAAASIQTWAAALRELYPKTGAAATPGNIAGLSAAWQREKLARLNDTYRELVRRGAVTAVLRTIETRLPATGEWALAELVPEWRTTQRSAFFIPVPAGAEAPVKPAEPEPTPAPPPSTGGPPPLMGAPQPPAPATPASPAEPAAAPGERPAGGGLIPNCASPEFFNEQALGCVQLLRYLGDFGPATYFAVAADRTPLNERCAALVETAWRRYCASYVRAWDSAYGSAPLAQLERLGRQSPGWEAFAQQFQPGPGGAAGDARVVIQNEFQPALSEVLHALRWPAYAAERGAWLEQPDPEYGPQKQRIAAAYAGALGTEWRQGQFAASAAVARASAATNLRPWEALAGEVAARWTEWCAAVGAAAVLPRRFDTVSVTRPGAIPWDGLTKLQSEANLSDERFTRQLVEFQKLAQGLLNAELTNRFAGLQAECFGEGVPYDGWPYVNQGGTGLTALETVDFAQFTKFLGLVQRATETFQALEQGLPDDPLRRTRLEFVHACEQWRDFLQLDAKGGTTPLEVTVSTADPVGEPDGLERVDDAGQHYYRKSLLRLGLRLQEAGDLAAFRPLEFQTTADARGRRVRAVWDWTRVAEQAELTYELVEGIQPERQDFRYPDIRPRVLGKPGALAFCAFLHRYGRFVDGNWVVTFGVDLAEKFKEANQAQLVAQLPSGARIIGEKYIFRLPSGRELPAPIAKLTAAGAAR